MSSVEMEYCTAVTVTESSENHTLSNDLSTFNNEDNKSNILQQCEPLLNIPPTTVEVASTNRYKYRYNSSSEPITYSWSNINVWTGSTKLPEVQQQNCNGNITNTKFTLFKKETKHILKNVSGVVKPGELVAILGASGAGKSTLLDTISFRNSYKIKVSGIRAINGSQIESNTITSISAYVQQIDLFFGVLTVKEHLIFQALVRMHKHIPHQERMDRVEQVIQEFRLTECANTQIGTKWFKGISGGEMKRLSIATEVLTDPMFMCCDEPTSGLDSTSAQNVILVLKNLSSKGKTVICTIHQPSSRLFALFDKVLLMTEGRVAFLGSTIDALEFFKTQGFTCPAMFNPADFLIDSLAIQNEDSRDIVQRICDVFDESPAGQEAKNTIDQHSHITLNYQNNHSKSPYKTSWFKQFGPVLSRSWITYVRDPMIFKMRILQTVILALFAGTIFYQLDLKTFVGVQNLSGAIFMFLCCLTYQHVIGTLDNFCSEVPVFLREHFNGMYRTDVYFISKVLVEIPFYIILPFLFTGICYFMVGLYPDITCFFKTVVVMILVTNICSGVGYFLSCSASTVTIALILVPIAIFPFFLFSGFLLRPGTGPIFLVWIEYISWFFYGYESLAIIQLENIQSIKCNIPNGTCPENGLAALETLGFDKDNFIFDIAALSVLALGSQVLAFLTLLARTYRQ